MQYREPKPITQEAAVEAFRTGRTTAIGDALLGLALHGQDPEFSLTWCLFYLWHPNAEVADIAACCIGHIARLQRRIDKRIVVPALQIVRDERPILGHINDALDDIATFGSD